VIAFDLEGNILDANENFCNAVGYRLDEIKGRHHRLFVDASTRRATNTAVSGAVWRAASSMLASSGASARAGARSGSRPPTTRSSIRPGAPTRS
jgi:PAS domain-containing protein